MIRLYSSRKSCPRSFRKSGFKCSITSIPLWTYSNLEKWSSWLWMVSLPDLKWTTKEPGDLRVQEITNNLFNDFTATMNKALPTVNRTLRTTQSLQEQNSCKSSMRWSISLSKRRFKKTIIGRILVLYSQDQTVQARVSTRSCNGSGLISISFLRMIVTVCMVQMRIWLCWVWRYQWKISVSFVRSTSTQPTRSKSKTLKSKNLYNLKWSFLPFSENISILSINNSRDSWRIYSTQFPKSSKTLCSCSSLLAMTSCPGAWRSISEKDPLKSWLVRLRPSWLRRKIMLLGRRKSI